LGDTTPIPGPSRGLSGSANLTVLLKFVSDQPLLPWQRKFDNFNRKLAITSLVWEIRPPFLDLVWVIGVGEFYCATEICARTTPVAMATKIRKFQQITDNNSACLGDTAPISGHSRGLCESANLTVQLKFVPVSWYHGSANLMASFKCSTLSHPTGDRLC